MGGRVGYEYRYRFWMEDEIIKLYKIRLYAGGIKSFLFEIRANFILKRRPDEGGVEEILDSERIDVCVEEKNGENILYFSAACRLREYWMSDDEFGSLTREAFDFAGRMAADPQHSSRRIIPVVVGVDVCTVQQEGEPLVSTIDRAIVARNLIPLYLSSFEKRMELKPKMDPGQIIFLRSLPRIRVEDVNQGLALMQSCGLCLRNPTIGAQVTSLPCGHVFHSHCVINYLEKNKLCPVCGSQPNSFSYMQSRYEALGIRLHFPRLH